MRETTDTPSQNIWLLLQGRVFPVIVFLYLVIALGVFIAVPFLTLHWLRIPFIGTMTDPNLVLENNPPSRAGSWELQKENLPFGYQLQKINGEAVTNTYQLERLLAQHKVGETITVSILTPQKNTVEYRITLQTFPVADLITYLYIPYLIGLVYLVCSLWMFGVRRQDIAGQAFSVLTASVALVLATLFETFTSHRLASLWLTGIGMAGGSLLNFSLLFPQEIPQVIRRPYLRWSGYFVALILIAFSLSTSYDYSNATAYVLFWRFEYLFTGFSVLFFVVWMLIRYFRPSSPIVREQARLILLGSVFSFGPIAAWFIITVLWPKFVFSPYILLFHSAFPIAVAFAILRYRWLNTDYLLSRAALYGLLIVLAVAGYGLLVTGLTMIFGQAFQVNNPYITGGVITLFAILLSPLRTRLQASVDSFFSRGQAIYREQLQAFNRDLTQALELPVILDLLRQYIQKAIVPSLYHIFVYDPLSDHYIASPEDNSSNAKPSSDLRFASNSALALTLINQRTSIFIGAINALPASLQSEQARLALLGAQLFVPLPGRKKLTGWLALGPRQSGDPYTRRDIEYLESLSDQAALAVERAQVVDDLERRIHEMNVLTRVSQGINITVSFDDILELIYAQTTQVFSTRDFRITLRDSYSDMLYHVFFLENDERLSSRENYPLHIGEGLEQDVLKSRQPIVTDDYERECRSRGVLPSAQNIFAWLGVPLNAGAETIGVISLGSRDPSVIFTNEQVNLLQAITDQAAGAIVKARLLQEAERRTRQLTTLNEVARSLTSTLELDPLLNQILQSAVDILNCEAGSLLLVDQSTGELVFEVVVGPPTSANLLHQRLPPGTGLVGKTVETRQAIIANDVRRAKEWFDKPDEQTGFQTRDLLVVPMQVKETVIGVIEVINRKDGLPFTPDDQELLTAFTSQAAIAIENARLYTQTDQTLAARVEELSVMQRIDRELNASLDVNRAMRITLEWAMRQSDANAGLVGVVEEQGIRVMASQGYAGYATDLATQKDDYLPIELPVIQQTIQTGQQHSLQVGEMEEKYTLLPNAIGQVAIPIRRESKTIGVILLESTQTEACSEEALVFLSRLSDHAAIAIANAQLYSEVQAANLAKSEFVSLVSHELKTPMTSIRGFTDLLAKGVIGPVNETQTNFLSTIRSNVERMAVLVSDLADVSRIEAGRLRLDYTAVSVAGIVEEVVRSTRAQIEEKSQILTLQIPENLPPIWGDRTRLIQILTNLVSNAYKYTPPSGQIFISAELADNQWNPAGAPKVIHIAVRDTGFGIGLEDQKKIFTKFFRADDQKIRETPGTGLGLNITKNLVETQGGRIWFESELRKGTTFHFTAPIVETA